MTHSLFIHIVTKICYECYESWTEENWSHINPDSVILCKRADGFYSLGRNDVHLVGHVPRKESDRNHRSTWNTRTHMHTHAHARTHTHTHTHKDEASVFYLFVVKYSCMYVCICVSPHRCEKKTHAPGCLPRQVFDIRGDNVVAVWAADQTRGVCQIHWCDCNRQRLGRCYWLSSYDTDRRCCSNWYQDRGGCQKLNERQIEDWIWIVCMILSAEVKM